MTLTTLWQRHLILLGLTISAIIAIFFRDAADMAMIWWNASTFTHCLFIIPITGWLIWQRKGEVALLPPRHYAPGLAVVGLAAFVWLIGEAAGVALFRHVALVLMIQATTLTLLGPIVTRGLLFPLFYLSFLVPFGDELVPMLQTITAKLSMLFLALFGVPATIDGVFIKIPTGLFEVAEACSGIKFLVAMVAYGALAANVCFKSWTRRVWFMVFAVVTPVIANGLRAFGTIYVSHITKNNDFASSVDHIIYGWFFFGAVMLIVMALSWRFFDRRIDDLWIEDVTASAAVAAKPSFLTAMATIALVLLPVGWQSSVAATGRIAMPNKTALPIVAGWQQVPIKQSVSWWPRFDGADHKMLSAYQNAAGQRVELAVAVYAWQADHRELVGYGQGAFDPDSHWAWTEDTTPPPNGNAVKIRTDGAAREVAIFYVIGGEVTGSAREVKIETLKGRLLGGDQSGVAVVVSAEDSAKAPARAAIDAFITAMGRVDTVAATIVAQARGTPQ
ncbi:MAG: exosortase A [Sphingomonadaceae bacterium]